MKNTINGCELSEMRSDFAKVERVLAATPAVDTSFSIPTEEFTARQRKTYEALRAAGLEVGLAFSNEHYDGDVPYLGGNTNVQIEQVAGLVGRNGFHIVAGLEGCYLAEQLAMRANAKVSRIEMLKLTGEDYTIGSRRIEEVIEEVAGGKVSQIGLLTPRMVIPSEMLATLEKVFGRENVIDCQELYHRIRYEKSDNEMRLMRDANIIADAMLRTMLAVLRPGMLETQVAAWGNFAGHMLGAEQMSWDVMVNANGANRSLIGKALNRPIRAGDYVHLGAGPKRDGLASCVRRSCVAVERPADVTENQNFWLRFIEEAYTVGWRAFREVAEKNLPAREVEAALIEYYESRSPEVSQRLGCSVALAQLRPYSAIHNTGYTECQEFFGAVTLHSREPLGHQVALMLDVALRGCHDGWNDVVIPGLDYVVVENSCGKRGPQLEELNALPKNVQALVGHGLDD
ncbi:MAG: M24 family metallopeptidase [Verrucomicrobiales bacterium]|nr:M24 family metallopeptidase [Verrucomicrobiales bacterium]